MLPSNQTSEMFFIGLRRLAQAESTLVTATPDAGSITGCGCAQERKISIVGASLRDRKPKELLHQIQATLNMFEY